jgi:DNA polymerase-3 subunit alpha
MKFTHLHVHSHYSLLDGLPKIDQLLDYAKKLGMDSVALTDHGTLYGAVEFYKKAVEKGIKPIIGSEVYMAFEKMSQERPNIDDKRYHLILLAKNEEGYKNLVKLLTKAHLEGFYYKPRIDEELLEKHSAGLICLSACLQGRIPKLIMAKKIEEAEKLALRYQKIFGKDGFYLEIQNHPHIPDQENVNRAIVSISRKFGIPLVATNDIHYLKTEDADAQDILMLINTGAEPNDPERLTLKADDFSMKSSEQMEKDFKDYPEALENTQKIVELCNFKFELGKTKLPVFKVPSGKTDYEYLRELCDLGLKKRFGENIKKEVLDRLEKELAVIKQTGFSSYFLIVQDFVNWAKENGIVVGPGRGSAAGSLVSYLLNITNVDPIKYDLIFERFLTPDRISPPDIDLDFTDVRRNEVINYVANKYGHDNVAQIITFGTMAARAVVRDVGRALGYAYSFCDQIAKMIPFGLTLEQTLKNVEEFRQLYETDDQAKKLIDFAEKLEGVARHASTHACGVVISAAPLSELIPLQHPTQDDETIVTQYEMHSIEDLGLLKMDLLGLKNLTIVENTINLINKNRNLKINVESLPENDEKTFRLLQTAETTGVFQLESDGMKRYLKQLKPSIFEDIVAMIALYRPGPMSIIPEYIDRKYKRKNIEYLHPKLEEILVKTSGLPIYQEQLMEIAQKLAGFTLTEADVLRKAVGKKIKSLLLAQKEKFIGGMMKNGVRKPVAQEIWEWILPFARYGFNRSHSVAYAQISYQTAYLKANYPTEFMAAVLNSEKADIERIGFLITECKKMGLKVLAPDINESEESFSVVGEKSIRFGLSTVKNVGINFVEQIVQERGKSSRFSSISDFLSRINTKDLNKKSMESLIKAGAFDELEERNCLLQNLESLLEYNREIKKNQLTGQKNLFANFSESKEKMKLKPAPKAKNSEKLAWEKELLGLFVTSHPLEDLKAIFSKKTFPIAEIDGTIIGRQIKIGGIISNIKKIITKTGKPMLFINLEDLTDKIEVIAFPRIIEKNPTAFYENKIVFVSGRVDNRDGTPKIICDEIEEIINEEI